jgi:hypothetical protein
MASGTVRRGGWTGTAMLAFPVAACRGQPFQYLHISNFNCIYVTKFSHGAYFDIFYNLFIERDSGTLVLSTTLFQRPI